MTTCDICQRERNLDDSADRWAYNPAQVYCGLQPGWYSSEAEEVCGGCMELLRSGDSLDTGSRPM